MDDSLAPSVSDQAAGEVSQIIGFFDSTFIIQGAEALFSRNMGKNAGFKVGMVIDFDHSSRGGQRNTGPKLI